MAPGTDHTQYREVLASLVQKTQTRFPDLNGRLTKATKLALMDDVELHDDGSATVHSASDPTRHYRIVEGTCPCRDWEHAPEHLCQHRLAAGLVRKAHELLPPAPDSTAVAPGSRTPLPEAPSSCNVYLTISGHKVQVTLRDSDEQRMLARLQILLAQYPASEPAAVPQAASQGKDWCAVHQTTMQRHENAKGVWFSHYVDGKHCKGKTA
jgi:hypothetical protein